MAQLKQVLHIKVVEPNERPQYTGPTEFLDGVKGGTQDIAQYAFDPDDDPLTYSVAANPLSTMTTSGILQYIASGEMDIEVTIDDGKTP